jgi:hypothetical protein
MRQLTAGYDIQLSNESDHLYISTSTTNAGDHLPLALKFSYDPQKQRAIQYAAAERKARFAAT